MSGLLHHVRAARTPSKDWPPRIPAHPPLTSVREAVRDKLVHAQAVLEQLGRRVESGSSTAMEWQKGYVKALVEMLNLQGVTLRRYPRWQTVIPSDIAQMVPKKGASGEIVDLSLGGCRLVTPMELSVGVIIALSFNHPERSTRVTLHGLVCRAERVREEYIAGVEFMGLPEDIAEVLGRQEAERRVSPRLSCNVSATVKVVCDGGRKLRTPLSGQSNNVSVEGASVLLPERVSVGARVALICSPAAGGAAAQVPPIETPATVVWTQETVAGPLRFLHGLRFLQPRPDFILQAWPGKVLG